MSYNNDFAAEFKAKQREYIKRRYGGRIGYLKANIADEFKHIGIIGLFDYSAKQMNSLKCNLIESSTVTKIFLLFIISLFTYQPYFGHGTSMLPTFKGGEIGILNKLIDKQDIEYGDIVGIDCGVIKNCIKRVIAKPGDHLVIENNRISINGELIQRQLLDPRDFSFSTSYADYYMAGLTESSIHQERLPNGLLHNVTYGKLTRFGEEISKKLESKKQLSSYSTDLEVQGLNSLILRAKHGLPDLSITLSDDEFYVLGDNRTNSVDSTTMGPIKWNNILGKSVIRTSTWLRYPLVWLSKTWRFVRSIF